MQATDVVALYLDLNRTGVTIWIDGGWAVDALAGRETRTHQDLDIAVESEQVGLLKACLEKSNYRFARRGHPLRLAGSLGSRKPSTLESP